MKADLGFVPDNVYLTQTELDPLRYDSTRVRAFQDGLLERVRALPGVEGAALGNRIPFGSNNDIIDVFVENRQARSDDGQRTPRPTAAMATG